MSAGETSGGGTHGMSHGACVRGVGSSTLAAHVQEQHMTSGSQPQYPSPFGMPQ
jgi:hypothetical protein